MTTLARRWDRFEKSPEAYLVVAGALMALILVPILVADLARMEQVVTVVLIGGATTIAMAASGAHTWAIRLSWMAPLVILAGILSPWENKVVTTTLGAGLVLMLISTPVVILRRIGRHDRVTATTMWGAIAAYLALGMAFSLIYLLIFQGNSEAFTNIDDESLGSFNYFSFVTMTTLGYGDIAPIDDVARAAVVLQTLVGQIYLVVVVARVVSLLGRPNAGSGLRSSSLGGGGSTAEDGDGADGHGSTDQGGQ